MAEPTYIDMQQRVIEQERALIRRIKAMERYAEETTNLVRDLKRHLKEGWL